MIKNIITKERLVEFARKAKSKRTNPGADNMTAETALIWIEINGDKLCRQIISGKYEPMPLNSFTVAKKDGKPRVLSKLTVIDSVIQNCILDGISEPLDNKFSAHSFAYRKSRGMTDAVAAYCRMGETHKFAARLDPYACFDNIDREILAEQLSTFIDDDVLNSLILSFVSAPMILERELVPKEKGIPQGTPLSPILCNIYLDPVDRALESKEIDFIRYADDIIIFADSPEQIQEYAELVKNEFGKLNLRLNGNKFKISTPAELEFLGQRFEKKHSGLIANQSKTNAKTYCGWAEEEIADNRRTVDIVSDGILRQKDFSLIFDTEEEDADIPVRETGIINTYSDVIFDSGAIKKAFKNGITINVFSQENHLLGRFIPNTGLHSPSVIFEQLQLYYNRDKRVRLAKQFLLASFHNARLVIRYYNKNCNDENQNILYEKALNLIDKAYTGIKGCNDYDKLLLLEAGGREAYYGCFDEFLSGSGFEFEKRSKRPPQNEVNALISFGNTMLYNYIATEINKSPLDIRVGFLHATNKRRESLNLDLAEIFKPLTVDRTVFTVINKKEITKEHFEKRNGGIYLTAEGKRIFIGAFYDKLDTTLQIKDSKLSYRQIIREEVQKLVRLFRDGEKYKPYKQVR